MKRHPMGDSFGGNEREEEGGERTQGLEWRETEWRQDGEVDLGVDSTPFGQTPAVRVYAGHAQVSWQPASP